MKNWLDYQYVRGELAVALTLFLASLLFKQTRAVLAKAGRAVVALATLPAKVDQIHHQLHPNNGGSVLDRVVSLEAQQRETSDQCSVSIYQGNLLLDAKSLAVARTDAAGKVVYVSDRWCKIAGIQRDEAMGDGWIKAVRADYQGDVVKRWRDAVATGSPCSVDFRFITGKFVRAVAEPMVRRERDVERVIGWQCKIDEARDQRPKPPVTDYRDATWPQELDQ